MKRFRYFNIALAVLVGVTGSNSRAAEPAAGSDAVSGVAIPADTAATAAAPEAGAPKTQPKITISKETTYITEPLRADGYPDYTKAINQRMSEGITAENNAAVLLIKAAGPGILPDDVRAEMLKKLGVGDLPASGNYFISQKEMIKRWRSQGHSEQEASDEALDQQFDDAQKRPWTKAEFPIVAQWLEVNAQPLELARQATEKPRYYFPYVNNQTEYPPAMSILLPLAQEVRPVAELLTVQAMQRLEQQDVAGAWQDLLACHRLGRLIAQGACLVEVLVGYAIDSLAIDADVVIAHEGKLSAAEALQMQTELRALPSFSNFVDKVNFTERCIYLDAVVYIARAGRYAALEKLLHLVVSQSSGKNDKKRALRTDDMAMDAVDWNMPLQTGNGFFDRLTSAGRMTDPRERRRTLRTIDPDLKSLGDEAKKAIYPGLMNYFARTTSKEEAGRVAGKLFPALLIPAIADGFRAEDRLRLLALMDQTAFALASYRADHGQYPEQLDALVPKYLTAVPDDTFADLPTPIRYRREGGAYKMWTVFQNGIDDNGRTVEDDPKCDDFVLSPIVKGK